MHKMDARSSSFRGYVSGGSRGVVGEIDDNHNMQEVKGNMMRGESRSKMERVQNYGFTSAILPGDKEGSEGVIKKGAEMIISYLGGNRSLPFIGAIDDRRHRPYGLKPGENAQYDDAHQMTYIARDGVYILSLDSKDKDDKNVERKSSLRHVEKKKQERKTGQQSQSAEGGGQQQQKEEEHKHKGDKLNTEVLCKKDRIEFRARDGSEDGKLVGYYDVPSSTWVFIGKVKLGDEKAADPVYGAKSGKGRINTQVTTTTDQPGPPTELDAQP